MAIELPTKDSIILDFCVECINNFCVLIGGGCQNCREFGIPSTYRDVIRYDRYADSNVLNDVPICKLFEACHNHDETIAFMKAIHCTDEYFLSDYFGTRKEMGIIEDTGSVLMLKRYADELVPLISSRIDTVSGDAFACGMYVDEFKLNVKGFVAFHTSGYFTPARSIKMSMDEYIQSISDRVDCYEICEQLYDKKLLGGRAEYIQKFAQEYVAAVRTEVLHSQTNIASDVIGIIVNY
jgi:hypothetical protein